MDTIHLQGGSAERAKIEKAVGVLKRLIRRKASVPFVLAVVEPKADEYGRLRGVPVIVSRGLEHGINSFLVDALLSELASLGAIKPAEKPE